MNNTGNQGMWRNANQAVTNPSGGAQRKTPGQGMPGAKSPQASAMAAMPGRQQQRLTGSVQPPLPNLRENAG